MKFINTALVVATAITIASCASVSSPEGGPRDTVPPTLVSSNPSDQELNVNTRIVRLEFDEHVQPVNMQKELMITPFTENKYKIRVDEEVIELTFEEPLQDSTTYTFNFRNSIADITEKNLVKNLRLSFSTGTYIDSSKITGKVVNLLTQQPEKEAIVALYPAEDTMDIRKSRPYYQTQTDASGQFNFENVREGNYRIYALQDKNNNSLYDNEAERIAFLKNPVAVKPDTQRVVLQTFVVDTKKPIALQRQKLADRFAITYNEGVEKVSAISIATKDTIQNKALPDGKLVELYRSQKFDGGKALITALDSAGNSTIDTIQIDFGTDYTQRIQGANLKVTTKGENTQSYRPGRKATLELQTQVTVKGATPITILYDSVTVASIKYPEQITLDKTGTELTFTVPQLSMRQRPYTIALDSTQLSPVYGKAIRYPQIPLNIGEGTAGTGSVKGNITTSAKSFIVQLLDGKYNVVKEVRNTKNFQFKNVEPGIYYIRVLLDENNNGRWDRGSGTFDREPEKVYLYPNQVEIRANWELEDIKIQL